MEGKLKREVIHVNIELIHLSVQQKLTQHCKVTILKKKRKKEREREERKRKGSACFSHPSLRACHFSSSLAFSILYPGD